MLRYVLKNVDVGENIKNSKGTKNIKEKGKFVQYCGEVL